MKKIHKVCNSCGKEHDHVVRESARPWIDHNGYQFAILFECDGFREDGEPCVSTLQINTGIKLEEFLK